MRQGFDGLGAGGVLLNSVDRHCSGLIMDMSSINSMKNAVGIPVLSTGAGAIGDLECLGRRGLQLHSGPNETKHER